MHYSNLDTIVALATPQGAGAIGIIRLSGSKAFELTELLFKGKKKISEVRSHTVHYGHLFFEGRLLDEVLVSVFKGPHSYTGEHVVEISCHGSSYILLEVLQAFVQLGARMAQPGEFTRRAFLNGKLDLSQAESVADIIAAENAAQHEMAFSQMRGGYAQVLQRLRNELITFAGLIELELDFSQEDVAFADRSALLKLLDTLENTLAQLIDSFALGNVLKKGIPVAIIGEPNVGKSTLLNALLNEEKALVSDIAGTTRDVIEDVLTLQGIPFRFLDTAGLRETGDVLEAQGIARSYEKLKTAQVVLYLCDSQKNTNDIVQALQTLPREQHQQWIVVLNKSDLESPERISMMVRELHAQIGLQVISLAAKTRDRVEELTHALVDWVHRHPMKMQGLLVSNTRHLEALKATLQAVLSIRDGIDNNISGDLIAIDMRMALYHLGSITGQVEVDRDILGTIFGKFCIGK